jgi:hypothetical protein
MKGGSVAAALAVAALTGPGQLAAQTSNEQEIDNLPARDDASTEKLLKDSERDRAASQANGKVSRVALEELARCLARKNPNEAGRVLAMDFTTPTYSRALRMLSEEDKSCIQFRGALRAGNLLFAGELAEALVEQRGEPVATALAKAAAAPATTAFSSTDRVAICVVRSVPGDVAQLLATERNSVAETTAVQALATPMGLCAQATEAKKPLSINPAGLRAMLATAAFRSVKDI